MADNQLIGPMPASIGNLTNLQTFYLYANALTGTIPDSFGGLNLLTQIQLYQNFLTGPIPESFYNNVDLQLIRLDHNKLSGTISSRIGDIANLRDLRIHENLFTGTLPASLTSLSGLGKYHRIREPTSNFLSYIIFVLQSIYSSTTTSSKGPSAMDSINLNLWTSQPSRTTCSQEAYQRLFSTSRPFESCISTTTSLMGPYR